MSAAVLLLDFFILLLTVDQSAFWKEMWAHKFIAYTTLATYVLESSILGDTWHSSMEDGQ